MPADNRSWSATRASEFTDKRLTYFWDSKQITAKIWQKVLGTRGPAWDVYFLYGAENQWKAKPTSPYFWMHQNYYITQAPRLDINELESKVKNLLARAK